MNHEKRRHTRQDARVVLPRAEWTMRRDVIQDKTLELSYHAQSEPWEETSYKTRHWSCLTSCKVNHEKRRHTGCDTRVVLPRTVWTMRRDVMQDKTLELSYHAQSEPWKETSCKTRHQSCLTTRRVNQEKRCHTRQDSRVVLPRAEWTMRKDVVQDKTLELSYHAQSEIWEETSYNTRH